jgi:hypothetical protein
MAAADDSGCERAAVGHQTLRRACLGASGRLNSLRLALRRVFAAALLNGMCRVRKEASRLQAAN